MSSWLLRPVGLAGAVALLSLAGCARNPRPAPPVGTPAPVDRFLPAVPDPTPGTVRLTILHINDVYEITPAEGGKTGGLARVATLLRDLERRNPNTIMTLGGDFLSPSAVGTARVNGERLAGRQMVAVLNAVGLDVAVLGNHEFDLTREELQRRIAESRFAYVTANATDSAGRGFPDVRPRLILAFAAGGAGGTDSVRVGITGVVVDANRRPWVRYAPFADALRNQVAALRDGVEAVVALTHLSLSQDAELAESVRGLDVILGGHEHENFLLRRGADWTPIVKADANARSVAVVDLDLAKGRPPRVAVRLLLITDSIPEDPTVAAEVRRWTDLADAAFRRDGFDPAAPVTTLTEPLDAREVIIRNEQNAFARLLAAAFRAELPGADLALVNSGSVRLDDRLPAGPLTQYDLIRLLPFGGTVVEATMRGSLLQRVLEQGERNRGGGGYLLRANVAPTGEGWRVGNAPLDTARTYRIATSDFLVSGGEAGLGWLREGAPGLRILGPKRDVRLVLMDELRRRYGSP